MTQVCLFLSLKYTCKEREKEVLISIDNGTAIANVDSSKVQTYCHPDDNICVNGDLILPAHLTYAENVSSAATFATS